MKKTLISLLILLCVLSSCDSLLDVEASNTLDGNQLIDDESIQSALTGAYFNLMGISDGVDGGELLGGDFQMMAELMIRNDEGGFLVDSDNNIIVLPFEIFWDESAAPFYENFVNKEINPTNFKVESNWRRAYETINLVNNILANIDNISDSNAKTRIRGESLAIRGILYFEMARLWGPQYSNSNASTLVIPLIVDPIVSVDDIGTPTKATLEAVYQRSEDDLKEASLALESSGTNGTNISYYACEAYLMRLFMQKNDYVNAEVHIGNVIGGTYSLVNNSLDAFNNVMNSSEDILAVQQTIANNTGTPGTGSGLATLYSSLSGEGLSTFRINPDAISSSVLLNNPRYSNTDVRGTVDLTTTTSTNDVTTGYYRDPVNSSIISSAKYLRNTDVVPLIRLAEVHLNRAECIYERTQAIDPTALSDLNLIRQRAGLAALTETNLNNDPDQFYDSLVLERNREFIYEGLIFHDIRRQAANGYTTGVLVGGSANPFISALDPRFILPIPQSECDATPGLCN